MGCREGEGRRLLNTQKLRNRLSSSFPGLQVKAKVMRKYVDHMVTLAKRGDLHARRQVRGLHRTNGE